MSAPDPAPTQADIQVASFFFSPPHSIVRPPSSVNSSSSVVAHRDITDQFPPSHSDSSSDTEEQTDPNAESQWQRLPAVNGAKQAVEHRPVFSPSSRRARTHSRLSDQVDTDSTATALPAAAPTVDDTSLDRDSKRRRTQGDADSATPLSILDIVNQVSLASSSQQVAALPPALSRPASLPPMTRADSISVENRGLPAPSPTDVLLAETPLPTSPELLLQSQLIQQQLQQPPQSNEHRVRTDSSPEQALSVTPPVESPTHHSSTPFTSPPRIADHGFHRLPIAQLPRIQLEPLNRQRIRLNVQEAPVSFMTLNQAVSDLEPYVAGITVSMHQRERMYQPFPAYFNTQSQLQPRMRGILFDWMTEVCQEFSLGRESHYLAMNLVDRYLSANPDVSRGRLQLIGVTALWMASKLDEIYPPRVQDFVLTTDNAYSAQDMLDAELDILQCLEWNLLSATAVSFVKLYLRLAVHHIHRLATTNNAFMHRCGGPDGLAELLQSFLRTDNFVRVMEIVDAASLRIESLQFYPSAIAASALCLLHPSAQLFIHNITPYNVQQLHPCLLFLNPLQGLSHRGLAMPVQPYFEVNIPLEDSYTRQLHHTEALEFCNHLDSNANNHSSTSSKRD